MLRQLTLGLGLPDHVAQEGESHTTFERVFQSMDVSDDRCISFPEFQRYLTRTGVAMSQLFLNGSGRCEGDCQDLYTTQALKALESGIRAMGRVRLRRQAFMDLVAGAKLVYHLRCALSQGDCAKARSILAHDANNVPTDVASAVQLIRDDVDIMEMRPALTEAIPKGRFEFQHRKGTWVDLRVVNSAPIQAVSGPSLSNGSHVPSTFQHACIIALGNTIGEKNRGVFTNGVAYLCG